MADVELNRTPRSSFASQRTDLRSFMAVVLGLFFLKGHLWALPAAGVVCLLIALIVPQIFSFPNKLWQDVGLILGWLMMPIFLTLIYFFVFSPMALILKMAKHQSFKNGEWILKKKPCNLKKSF